MEIQSKLVELLSKMLNILYDKDKSEALNSNFNFDINIVEEFDLNSLDMIEFGLLIQEEFDVDINDDDYEELITINRFANFIEKQRT